MTADREFLADARNPIGLDGIEYIEYTTSQPEVLGGLLQQVGFRPVARHRSREVLLYRQGPMNLIVNAHRGVVKSAPGPGELPRISAVALRVHDARAAYEHALAAGAWEVPVHAHAMELHIPAIHGPGGSHLYFVDRHREFSIYDVDFIPLPGAEQQPPALAALHWFGVVQYIGRDRTADWIEFYRQLFGFEPLPAEQRFGVLPEGTVLKSPCGSFYLQLNEPHPSTVLYDDEELFHRIGLGTPDVLGAVAQWRASGIEFVESAKTHTAEQGALTRTYLRSVAFELVRDAPH
jgi:4-hydroxyphenylpyruvate dioxygenase